MRRMCSESSCRSQETLRIPPPSPHLCLYLLGRCRGPQGPVTPPPLPPSLSHCGSDKRQRAAAIASNQAAGGRWLRHSEGYRESNTLVHILVHDVDQDGPYMGYTGL
ncbi:unnamed protein product [Boreogadus saida]